MNKFLGFLFGCGGGLCAGALQAYGALGLGLGATELFGTPKAAGPVAVTSMVLGCLVGSGQMAGMAAAADEGRTPFPRAVEEFTSVAAKASILATIAATVYFGIGMHKEYLQGPNALSSHVAQVEPEANSLNP